MTASFHVKMRLAAAVFTLISGTVQAAETPDAAAILKSVRLAQAAQERTVTGRLRSGGKAIPFTLKMEGNDVRWDFTNPPQTLLLRMGEKDSRLEEVTGKGAVKVSGARFDDKVRESDVSYEDLAMRFLYWPDASIQGEQTMVLTKCWIVQVEPPARSDSQYSRVKLWISKGEGALMQAEAYDRAGNFSRRFKVLSGQKTSEGLWMLKQMRIEAVAPGRRGDLSPTYLEIDKPSS